VTADRADPTIHWRDKIIPAFGSSTKRVGINSVAGGTVSIAEATNA
jgi:hypothetical protein